MTVQLLNKAVFAAMGGNVKQLEYLLRGGGFEIEGASIWRAAITSSRPTESVALLLKYGKPDVKLLAFAADEGVWAAVDLLADALSNQKDRKGWEKIAEIIAGADQRQGRTMVPNSESSKVRSVNWFSKILTNNPIVATEQSRS